MNNVISFVVGRFQPFHNGHIELIDKAIEIAERNDGLTVIFIGSSNVKESNRNPFNFYKRVDMISKSYGSEELKKIIICPLPDFDDDNEWTDHISHNLKAIAEKNCMDYNKVDIKAIVCDKDEDTTESNNLLENIERCKVVRVDTTIKINATDIRKMLFEDGYKTHELKHLIPYSTESVLREFT